MKGAVGRRMIASLLLWFSSLGSTVAQTYGQLDAVVTKSAELVERQFVNAEVGKRTAATLLRRLSAGQYAHVSTAAQLEQRLSDDLRAISGDNHIGVVFDPASVARYRVRQAAPDSVAAKAENEANRKTAIAESTLDNFGIRSIETLPGRVGYLRLDYFDGLVEESAPAIAAAMNLLAGSDAIILDLRQNGGGNSKVLPMFLGYFLGPGPVHFATRVERWKGEQQALFTLDNVPGARHVDKPLYILTSGTTFSLAEQVTYHLKAFGRVIVVGERTYGGGNGFDPVVLNDDFYLRIPRVVFNNAITGTTFVEGQGIAPDIAVNAGDAKNRAYVEALRRLQGSATNQERRQEIAWAMPMALARLDAGIVSGNADTTQFAGSFDNLVFESRIDGLWLSFRGLPFVLLERLGPGLYLDERSILRQFRFASGGSTRSPHLILSRYGYPEIKVKRSD
jgi:hypothetical protein